MRGSLGGVRLYPFAASPEPAFAVSVPNAESIGPVPLRVSFPADGVGKLRPRRGHKGYARGRGGSPVRSIEAKMVRHTDQSRLASPRASPRTNSARTGLACLLSFGDAPDAVSLRRRRCGPLPYEVRTAFAGGLALLVSTVRATKAAKAQTEIDATIFVGSVGPGRVCVERGAHGAHRQLPVRLATRRWQRQSPRCTSAHSSRFLPSSHSSLLSPLS